MVPSSTMADVPVTLTFGEVARTGMVRRPRTCCAIDGLNGQFGFAAWNIQETIQK
jgi:hypothetical protein